MASSNISRRWFVGALGAGVLATPLLAEAESIPPARPHDLRPGDRLARWIIAEIAPLDRGAVGVVLHGVDDARHRFRLEILARDPSPSAVRPPAETRHFAVFVCNGGDGWSPTLEDQGLAAMTLAARLARVEADGDATGLLTHAQRIALHAESMVQSG